MVGIGDVGKSSMLACIAVLFCDTDERMRNLEKISRVLVDSSYDL